eukprot:GEMP01039765.1.p1 GENE.GEMP01039765.1~~GEMP01039765.1.p1  ORF type:complete len:510 (+),score=115.14 GEMP01039765.1:199-1728(+)
MTYSLVDSLSMLDSHTGIAAKTLTDVVSQLRRELNRVKERLQPISQREKTTHPHRYEADVRALRMELEKLDFTPPPRYHSPANTRRIMRPLLLESNDMDTYAPANHPNPSGRLDLPIARPGSPQRTHQVDDACVPSLSIPSLTNTERKHIFADHTNAAFRQRETSFRYRETTASPRSLIAVVEKCDNLSPRSYRFTQRQEPEQLSRTQSPGREQAPPSTHRIEPAHRNESVRDGAITERRRRHRNSDEKHHQKTSVQGTSRERAFNSPRHGSTERTRNSPRHRWASTIDDSVNLDAWYRGEEPWPARAASTSKSRYEDDNGRQQTQKMDVSVARSTTRGRHSAHGGARRRTPSATQRLGSPDKRRVRSAPSDSKNINHRTRWDRLAQPKLPHDPDHRARRRSSRDRPPRQSGTQRIASSFQSPRQRPSSARGQRNPKQRVRKEGFAPNAAPLGPTAYGGSSHLNGAYSGLSGPTGRAARCTVRGEFNDLWRVVSTLRADYNSLLCKLAH